MLRFISLLGALFSCCALGDDFGATSAEDRAKSWQQHEKMRVESPFYSLWWRSIGPELQGGRIESIAVHPEDTSIMYAGVGSGGLWKTENSGISWSPIFEQQASMAIGDVAIDPSEPNTLWLGTGEVLLARSSLPGMGIYKSLDAGRTWENVGLKDSQHIARVIVHPSKSDTVFVAAIGHQNSSNEQRGVFRTTDAGKSWEKVLYLDDQSAAIDLVIHPENPEVLFACMWARGKPEEQQTTEGSGIYKSADGGSTWSRLGNGLHSGRQVGRIAIDIAASNPQVMYALADEGDVDWLYRSDDSGESWVRVYDKLKARWDWCELRVSPENENEVYSIGQNSYVSKNGGKTFTKIAGRVVHLRQHGARGLHLDTHAMWINPRNPDHVIFGTDGGLFVTQDRCRTWLHLNNMPIAECYAATYDMEKPFRVYVGTQDNAALYGPSTSRPIVGRPDEWKHVYLDPWGGGDSYFTYRDPVDDDTIYFEQQYGVLRRKDMATGRTVDIQPRSSEQELSFAWMTPFFPSAHNASSLYCGANFVFKSNNRGDQWKVISENLVSQREMPGVRYSAITTLAESPIKPGVLFAGTDRADLWLTTDDGANWHEIGEDLPSRGFTRVHPSAHDVQRVFASQSGSGIDDYQAYLFRSDDQGKTWQSISDGLPMEPVNVVVEDPTVPNLLYVGTDMGIYVSVDGGKHWDSLCNNLPTTAVSDLFVHPRDNVLVIATHGRSCFSLDPALVQDTAQSLVSVGSKRQLFVDDFLVKRLTGDAKLQLQIPEPREVVLTLDKPWEGNTSAYVTMFQDGDRYRAWYRGSHYDTQTKKGTHPEYTCYAESKDGITWSKPDLGLFEFDGSKRNNIVWDGVGTHCFTPFKDENPNCRPEAQYKAISRGRPQRGKGLYAFQSPDGIHWSLMQEEPIITVGAFDSQNLAFWDTQTQCYRCYHRNFRNGVRDIMTQTSSDFLHWSKPEYIRLPNVPREHLYTNAIQQYSRAPQIYIGFPTRYLPNEGARVEPTFMSGRDGRLFRRWTQPVIPESAPSERAGNRSNYMVHGLLELPAKHGGDHELSVFGTEAYYEGPDNRVRRFVYRKDGFVALQASKEGGRMHSKPIVFKGNTLLLNFQTEAEGYLQLKISDAMNPARRLEFDRLSGDDVEHRVAIDPSKLEEFAGKPCVIEVELRDARLFSFKFQERDVQ